MLYFCFRLQIEPLDKIEARLIVMSDAVIEHVNKCHDLFHLVKYSIMTRLN